MKIITEETRVMKVLRLFLMVVLSAGLFSGLALAKGNGKAKGRNQSTAAQETVCDDLNGAAYGLCNAYCEAMDCDGNPEATANACEKVAANFTKVTDGAPPPCELPPPDPEIEPEPEPDPEPEPELVACPCFTAEDIETGGEMLFCDDIGVTLLDGGFLAEFLVFPADGVCFVETATTFISISGLTPEESDACAAITASSCN